MKFQSLFLAAFAGIAVAQELTRCGTVEPDEGLQAELNEAFVSRPASTNTTKARSVDTYVHVVTSASKRSKYTQAMVEEQMEVMNDAYQTLGVTFNTVSINFTINEAWASAAMDSTAEYNMKSALHQGSYSDLNLYFTSDLPNGLLGFCYFPLSSPSNKDRILDGCMCLADSMPGGTSTNYDKGYTAVHETGHWFGLYHVFQGSSCSGSGDYVSDTPIQKTATSGCPATQDSCPNSPGNDSIHNFMDYSYDDCMYEFTDDQVDRAVSLYDQQRAGK